MQENGLSARSDAAWRQEIQTRYGKEKQGDSVYMGRIAFVWEFGGGLGHIKPMLPLARMLQEKGHEVCCVMKNIVDAEKVLGQHGLKILQAPLWQVRVKQLSNSYNYAETLFNFGYLVPGALFSMAEAWRNLFDLLEPDLILADHAPTALIAARGTPVKVALFGTGFVSPPRQSPMPSIIPWAAPKKDLLEYSEKKAVQIINNVLAALNSPLIENVYDLFEVEENFLATFKELDHYQTREPAKYWGPVLGNDDGDSPKWPGTIKTPKVFCYLKENYPHIKILLQELKKLQASVLVYLNGLSEEFSQRFTGANLFFVSEPLNMEMVCSETDLVVCHAGHGTAAMSLLHGKPLVLLPEHKHLEQILLTQNIVKFRAAQAILTEQPERDFKGTIEKVLRDPLYRNRAIAFTEKYRDFNCASQVEKIVCRCEEIINGKEG